MLKVRTLNGPEKLKVLSNIDIKASLPTDPPSETARIQNIWNGLLEINSILSKSEDELSPAYIIRFEIQAREWVKQFTDVYHARNITPYIHAMASHVSEFMKLHGSIVSFTQQGLEKYNDCMTKTYFRVTNHKEVHSL